MKRACLLALLLTVSAFVLGPALAPSQDRLLTSAHRHINEYDAEFHIGLVAENSNQAVAEANTTKLNAALAAGHAGGSFDFAAGNDGPVLLPIRFSGKTFYFYGAIRTPARPGGQLLGAAATGALMPADGTAWRGSVTRIVQLAGGQASAPGVIVLSGSGTRIQGFEILGRDYPTGGTPAGPGTKTTAGIVVEGRTFPPSGHHDISGCSFVDTTYAIQTVAGYWSSDWATFNADENHADHSRVGNCNFATVESAFRSQNQQSVSWSFDDCSFNILGTGEMVVFDIVRGGCLYARNLALNHNKITLVKVTEYSHNTQRIDIEGFRWDTLNGPTEYLTLFQYAGPVGDTSVAHWTVRLKGHIANNGTAYDETQMFKSADTGTDFPWDDILFDVSRLPASSVLSGYDFETVGSWQRLVPE